jgi:uncharacterized LabA/DUF88 family protein
MRDGKKMTRSSPSALSARRSSQSVTASTMNSENNDRVLLVIDGPNLFHGGLDEFPDKSIVRVDFMRLRRRAERYGDVDQALAFVVTAPGDRSNGVIGALKRCGFDVRHKELSYHGNKVKGANCEVDLSVEVMDCVEDYDRLVLVTGSRSYVPLVSKVKGLGKRVTVMMFAAALSGDLADMADNVLPLGSSDLLQGR